MATGRSLVGYPVFDGPKVEAGQPNGPCTHSWRSLGERGQNAVAPACHGVAARHPALHAAAAITTGV